MTKQKKPDVVVAIASVLLQKQEGPTVTTSMAQYYWKNGIENEDQLRGVAIKEAFKDKPGMSVIGVLTNIIRIPRK